jgi:peptidoglycan/LPS O-acetylase OafA/YrhL
MIANLQILRAVAAYLVVFNHAGRGPFATFGHFGVDLFFVISGFVMVFTTSAKRVTPGDFALNRIIRIVPLYWLLTLAIFAVALVVPAVVQGTRPDLVELIKSLLFIPFVKSSGIVQPVLFLGWTLNLEMMFYAIFALALFIPSVSGRVVTAVAVLVAMVLAGYVFAPVDLVAKFVLDPILLEFAYGMVLGYFYHRGVLQRLSAPLAVGLAVMGIGLFVATGLPAYDISRAYLPGIPAAIVVAGALAMEARGIRYAGAFAMLLGAASYSLYLSHPFVVFGIAAVARRLGFSDTGLWWPVVVAQFVAVTIVSIALFKLFEKPAGKFFRAMLDKRLAFRKREGAAV